MHSNIRKLYRHRVILEVTMKSKDLYRDQGDG